NDYQDSLDLINRAIEKVGKERLMIAPSCSLMHVPCDLELETDKKTLPFETKQWLAFAKQKLAEIVDLKRLTDAEKDPAALLNLKQNQLAMAARRSSSSIHNKKVKERIKAITEADAKRESPFSE